jgi:hypothetical protein
VVALVKVPSEPDDDPMNQFDDAVFQVPLPPSAVPSAVQ